MPRKATELNSASGTSALSFESEFERLSAIVDRLEAGNVPLNDMLKLYEEGIGLSTSLTEVLTQAELKVEKLARMHEERISAGTISMPDNGGEPEDTDTDLLF